MDQASPGIRDDIRDAVMQDPAVREVDHIRVHPLGSYWMVDLEVYLDGGLSLHDAHDVAHRVADTVKERFERVQDVKVHVNPTEADAKGRGGTSPD
jgi:divalent metal cation (Fe/Co/Zn/Cd) transporter